MAKYTEIEGYSVIVFVAVRDESVGIFSGTRRQTAPQALRSANEIKDAIRRHLSHDFGDVMERNIDIEAQTKVTCDSCGEAWTEKSDTYNGGCCDADEEDEEQRKRDNSGLGVGA